ncbi:MAG: MBL fold metallo-hydrolase [Pseudomonadota bacterium]
MSHRIHALELGPMENFIYLIEDVTSRRAAVVDPAWDVPAIDELAGRLDLNITDILLTHSHHDHINGLSGLLERHDAELHLLRSEYRFWDCGDYRPSLCDGGDTIELGETKIHVLHTPGHTPGSACYQVGDDLITGDTLFVFGCGRCDLRGGDPEEMYNTLKNLREKLPAGTVVHPGHNYGASPTATMAEEAEGNPFMHFDDPALFRRYRMQDHGKLRSQPYHPVSPEEIKKLYS